MLYPIQELGPALGVEVAEPSSMPENRPPFQKRQQQAELAPKPGGTGGKCGLDSLLDILPAVCVQGDGVRDDRHGERPERAAYRGDHRV